MKRSTPLPRRTPMPPARKPLARTSGIAPVGARKSATADGKPVRSTFKQTRWTPAVPAAVSAALTARSGGVCEIALHGCTTVATDPCHRVKQGMGGRHGDAKAANNALSNLMHGCRPCHQWTHSRSVEAYEMGIRLREGFDPASEPALYRGALVFLTDSGAVVTVDVPV